VFKINEYIVYGNDGVCKVEGIGKPDFYDESSDKKYYMLKPVFCDNSIIYSPIDNSRVVMRRVITKEEVQELINLIPEISTNFTIVQISALSRAFPSSPKVVPSLNLTGPTKIGNSPAKIFSSTAFTCS
jgi:RNA polymerase-interacting CarD/CdnL/TRCF family regulator